MMISTQKITNKSMRDINKKSITGKICLIDEEEFYCIRNVDRMAPFLMSMTSSDNLWMYISSRCGLTAGRVNEEGCLFPSETEEKLHYGHTHTRPVAVIRFSLT